MLLSMSSNKSLVQYGLRMNSTAEPKTMHEKLASMTYNYPRIRLYENKDVDRSFADSGQELYINFVGPNATEESIKEKFSQFGIVVKVNLLPAKDSFSSKCWVKMESMEAAKLALMEMGT